MIVTVTLNPCVDHTLFIDGLRPHDTNRVSSVEIDAGGKGINASRVIASLGGQTLATGFLGGSTGAFVRHVLEHEAVPYSFTSIVGETRINFAVEDQTGRPPTCFNEPGPAITEHEVENLVHKVSSNLAAGCWLHLAGSKPRGLDISVFSRIGQLARARSAKFAVDADGENLREALKSGPSFVKPNVGEASHLLGKPLGSTSDILNAASEIRRMIIDANPVDLPLVVISRGVKGAVLADEEGLWIGNTPVVEVRSTVGSGDSMVAAMLTALDRGKSPHEALAFGMAAGAATAEKVGSGLAGLEQTNALLHQCRVKFAGPIKC